MEEFGSLLKRFREATSYPSSHLGYLSQTQFAHEIHEESGMTFSYGTISRWEKGKYSFRTRDRDLILTLIKVLLDFGGIRTLDEANQLLLSAEHTPLNNREIQEIKPEWQHGMTRTIEISSHATQYAAIPNPGLLVGRAGLIADLDTRLRLEHGVGSIFLVGVSGIGKSMLAATLARQHVSQDDFVSVAWIPFYSSPDQTAEAALANLTRQIGEWFAIKDLSQTSAEARFAQVFECLNNDRHLLVIDGVDTPEENHALAQHLAALRGQSKFIVTTQVDPRAPIDAFIQPVPYLSEEESHQFLLEQTIRSGGVAATEITLNVARSIHNAVGGHPLTLSILPTLLRRVPLDQLLQGVDKGRYINHHALFGTLWSTFTDQERKAAFSLSLFGQRGGSGKELAQIWAAQPNDVQPEIDRLTDYALCQIQGTPQRLTYSMHPLTIQFIRQWANIGLDNYDDLKVIVVRALHYWHALITTNDAPITVQLSADIQECLKFAKRFADSPESTEAEVRLLTDLHPKLKSDGLLTLWESAWSALVEQCAAFPHIDRAVLLNQLGIIFSAKSNPDQALEAHQRALAIAEASENQNEIAHAHHHMSWSYYVKQDVDRANHHIIQALESYSDVQFHGYEYGQALVRYGIYYMSREVYADAERMYRTALSYFENTEQYEALSLVYYNLGILYSFQEAYIEGIEAFGLAKDALRLYPDPIRQMRTFMAEGTLHLKHGVLDLAAAEFRSVDIDFLERTHNYSYLAMVQNNLAHVLIEEGRLDEAEKLLTECLTYWERVDQPYNEAVTLSTYGDMAVAKEDLTGARYWFTKALKRIKGLPRSAELNELKEHIGAKLNVANKQR